MIPLKLSLQNFLCYRDDVPTLDLSGIHVACLCGANGHGKSALLDAITWSLWGNARGKSQDDLIHFGRDEMSVDLEFLARGTEYRVIRRHSRSGLRGHRGATDLQLQISAGNGYQPITGNTIRETQAKINQLIGMDYDTFINSAFLIQGRADEFTNKSPGERKEVLANILGLSLYDQLQERSRKLAREKENQADAIKATISFMKEEVARKEQYQRDLEETTVSLERLSDALNAKSRGVEALRMQLQVLEQKAQELRDLKSSIPRIQEEFRYFQQEIKDRASRIEEYRSLVNIRSNILEGFQRYQKLQEDYEELNRASTRYHDLRQQAADLRQAIGQAKTRLEEQIRSLKHRLEGELEPRAKATPEVEMQLAQTRRTLESYTTEEEDLARKRIHLQELATQVGQLKAVQERLAVEGKELRAKHTLLDRSHQNVQCPLCDSPLGEEGCQRLSESYQAQIQEKAQLYKGNQATLQETQRQKDRLDLEIPEKEAALRRRQQQAQSRVATLERDLEECHSASTEVAGVHQELEELEGQLRDGMYTPSEHSSLRDLEEKMATLGYSPELRESLYREIQECQPYQQQYNHLTQALDRLPQEEASLDRAKEIEQHRQEELAQAEERLAQMETETEQLQARKKELTAAESELQRLQVKQQELLSRRGALEGNLQKIKSMEKEMADRAKEVTALQKEQGIYQELGQAFGRQGLQAMLIESVLPRLEEEANELLSRMTDGRMNVKLETQRQLRSRHGEYAETLEIKISDELGPRNYEMFSGGEAFRINLALRIALSKVLAHRSGAPLPTLFIDEGFGTQDTAGRERILDVIRAIEPDFQKIIVITHLEELREAFPVRIEVEKTDSGSTCWLS